MHKERKKAVKAMGIRDHEAIRAILGRRSIRRFEEKPVEKEKIELLIECGSAAPSAANSRPCHFVVATDRPILNRLAEDHPYGKMLFEAPLAIIVCGNPEKNDFARRYWEEDCSAAMQNILVAAHAIGLDGVWLGVRHAEGCEEAIRKILPIPAHIAVLGIAALGYGKEKKDPHKGIEEGTLHVNGW